MSIIGAIIVGGIAGWLAGKVFRGKGFGLLMNIIIGIVGGIVGRFTFSLLGFTSGGGWMSSIITAFIGALIILAVANLLRNK